ncbi:MAG: hypothetical protein FWH41_01990 [Treponema sp.]|nr:hypothetical protein [Treponema sp.]
MTKYVGGIAGYVTSTEIDSCSKEGSINVEGQGAVWAGGICGYIVGGLSGSNNAGGLVICK